MHVRFEMSGGYGGLFALEPLESEVNSTELPDVEREAFEAMARAAMAPPAEAPDDAATAADLMTYRLSFVDDESWEVVLDERTVPAETWPLLEHMRELAVRRRAEGA